MRVMFTINSGPDDPKQAVALKEKLEALMSEFGLEGTTRGDEYSKRASYSGSYRSSAKED
ncbi:hypothetical protein [Desulfosporosinus sp. Sb-LF]|uniref:hypothetical protein n=1 Tax=Desulfosporosinus sp. Sb-LF TaxID=2560027 RepID=UPI00107F5EB9|nr:hypothetical protein [Desulfosporosinus sp. Sb-LF]TGE32131.1 hypothetical protein E4K68_13500 [Desulfosporosinus sp. Sb-LF]